MNYQIYGTHDIPPEATYPSYRYRRQKSALAGRRLMIACRPGCAACCIAPSISSLDKPAGFPCAHLDHDLRCTIFGRPERPPVCASLQPDIAMCGETREAALAWIERLEVQTRPDPEAGLPQR